MGALVTCMKKNTKFDLTLGSAKSNIRPKWNKKIYFFIYHVRNTKCQYLIGNELL
jgi:hypothetical protein